MKGLVKFEPSSYYHVINHAVGSENLFRCLCYCLMPNHIHFLIRTIDEEAPLKHPKFKDDFHKLVMQELSNLLNAYTKAYNKNYERRGALWIDFTKRFQHVIDCLLHISGSNNFPSPSLAQQ
ncbi:MAG: hypothetical protein GYB55_03590 [Cytophagales bacterium]|uniref:hypothetical protein n=1 Tax=Cyclobacterium marinum TaxID=104 RepID=UPI0030D9628A|nr:hypothetical protein [Cytophagales bacterium]